MDQTSPTEKYRQKKRPRPEDKNEGDEDEEDTEEEEDDDEEDEEDEENEEEEEEDEEDEENEEEENEEDEDKEEKETSDFLTHILPSSDEFSFHSELLTSTAQFDHWKVIFDSNGGIPDDIWRLHTLGPSAMHMCWFNFQGSTGEKPCIAVPVYIGASGIAMAQGILRFNTTCEEAHSHRKLGVPLLQAICASKHLGITYLFIEPVGRFADLLSSVITSLPEGCCSMGGNLDPKSKNGINKWMVPQAKIKLKFGHGYKTLISWTLRQPSSCNGCDSSISFTGHHHHNRETNVKLGVFINDANVYWKFGTQCVDSCDNPLLATQKKLPWLIHAPNNFLSSLFGRFLCIFNAKKWTQITCQLKRKSASIKRKNLL